MATPDHRVACRPSLGFAQFLQALFLFLCQSFCELGPCDHRHAQEAGKQDRSLAPGRSLALPLSRKSRFLSVSDSGGLIRSRRT